KVSDVTTIVARVSGGEDVGIAKVEFMVDDQLRSTDTSTPYSFDWDTLDETEGSHTLTATVFDAKGQTKRAKLSVMVDNELSKGADYHADAAMDSLKAGNPGAAANSARKALKIDPMNRKAAR